MNKKNPSKRNVEGHTSDVFARNPGVPGQEDVARAATLLNAGKKVAMMAGRGAIKASAELEELAEKLAAPILKPILGKSAVPDESPYCTGPIGLLGTRPSQEAIENCDTLLMVGTSFPYIEFIPKPGQARAVQIDLDPIRLGLRYPVEVGLVGDSKKTLQMLLPQLARKEDRSFLEEAQKGMEDWWELMEERGTRDDHPTKPQVVAWELNNLLTDDAIISADSGSITTGGRGKSRRGAGRCFPAPAPSRAWLALCPTPWPRRSRIPTANASRSLETARFPC